MSTPPPPPPAAEPKLDPVPRAPGREPRADDVLCERCGWTYGMICPECLPGCGCSRGCSGWRHAEYNDGAPFGESDDDGCECGPYPDGECQCFD